METSCEHCAHKTCNNVKCIGGIGKHRGEGDMAGNYEAKGTRISLNITGPEDINRDLLKVTIV